MFAHILGSSLFLMHTSTAQVAARFLGRDFIASGNNSLANTALEPTATTPCAPTLVAIRPLIARPPVYFRGRGSALVR